MTSNKKKTLTPAQEKVCIRLRTIWDARCEELGLTQELAAQKLGITQGAVSHYLNKRNALGFEMTFRWAQLLRVHPYDLDPEFPSQLPADLRLVVDNMLIAPNKAVVDACRSVVSGAMLLHDAKHAPREVEQNSNPGTC